MKCKFLHFSDAHLGYQQYGHKERFNDFGRAFLYVIDRALEERVDFVIFAGDLFQKRTIDPLTLIQAIEGLDKLRQAGIPVLSIEGNHERAPYNQMAWTDFLADQGFLKMLTPVFQQGEPVLSAWDGMQGAYVDLDVPVSAQNGGDTQSGVVRVYGVKYYGAATKQVLKSLIEALAEMDHSGIDYVVLILHAGLDDVFSNISALVSHSEMSPLQDYVNYLALGHVHKPYHREGWIYNPGSLETCSVAEIEWPNRGYYLVEVDTDQNPVHQARLVPVPRRPFVRLSIDVEQSNNPEALYTLAERIIKAEATQFSSDRPPVVEVTLEGVLAFDSGELDVARIQALAETAFSPLLARCINRTVPTGFEVRAEDSQPRADLERQVIRELVERDARYRPLSDQWARLIQDVKRMVLEGTTPETIIDHVNRNRPQEEAAGQENPQETPERAG